MRLTGAVADLARCPAESRTGHPSLTAAAITGALALAVAAWRIPRATRPDMAAVAVLSAASVHLWRTSAHMTQLNRDGLPGSGNDWAEPVLTYTIEHDKHLRRSRPNGRTS